MRRATKLGDEFALLVALALLIRVSRTSKSRMSSS